MQKVIKYGARDMESMSIPYILQCTIQYNALCHVIKFLSVYCVGFPEFRVNKADQKPKTWLNLMQTMMQTWLNLMQTMIPLIANIMYSPWERLLLLSGHQWKGS